VTVLFPFVPARALDESLVRSCATSSLPPVACGEPSVLDRVAAAISASFPIPAFADAVPSSSGRVATVSASIESAPVALPSRSMTSFPRASSVEQFRSIPRDDERLAIGARSACERHGVIGAVTRFGTGSLPVFAAGEAHVLKLFPPCYAHEAEIEHDALRAVESRLSIPTPRVRAGGEMDGWRYVLMERLRGRSLAEAWPEIPSARHEAIAEEVGAATAALHAIEIDSVGIRVPRPDWRAFVTEQRAQCVERQRARGLAPEWLEQIPAFLETVPLGDRSVLLHTEIMREHLLVEPDAGRWTLSGLFDFEPAMIGDADYECASVGIFVASGDAALLRRFIAGYGRDPGARVFLAYALLHKYSSLRWYLERVPPPPGVGTLGELADAWWSA
jgi:hygromycin-B 7''-O-kinase